MLETVVAELIEAGFEIDLRVGDGDAVAILDVEHDSRLARAGSMFCAVHGESVDGHDFIPQAIANGASSLLVERWTEIDTPQIRTDAVRGAMPHVAAIVHGRPSTQIDIVGITGTNGKTTTTQLLGAILDHAGKKVATVGTLSGGHTTPESTVLQRRLRALVDDGTDVVAMEVSSHALDQHRADAVEFAVVAFSNLTPDHLDYHVDMEHYFMAKARLFDGRAQHELVNVDDEWGRRLARMRPDALPLSLSHVTIRAADMTSTRFEWRGMIVDFPMPGRMNVANALMAAEAAALLGVPDADVVAGLSSTPPVRGRMELVENPHDDRVVIVDYSHTPDSIERAIATVREGAGDASVTIVFGCGGDRDRTKRPMMARAAEAADHVVVTSDNPRSEDPDAIIADAVAGLARPASAITEPDRRSAIALALTRAHPNGVVLIAGKGHETTQTIGDQVLDFDDVAVAAELLEETAK